MNNKRLFSVHGRWGPKWNVLRVTLFHNSHKIVSYSTQGSRSNDRTSQGANFNEWFRMMFKFPWKTLFQCHHILPLSIVYSSYKQWVFCIRGFDPWKQFWQTKRNSNKLNLPILLADKINFIASSNMQVRYGLGSLRLMPI